MGILRRAPVVVAAAVAAAALLSCTDESPGPTETATPPTAPVTTAPPTTAVPTPPADLSSDATGAEAFVRYFWDVYSYAYASGDTVDLREISANSCKFCESAADDIEALVKSGGSSRGGAVHVEQIFPIPPNPGAGVIVNVRIRQDPSAVVDAQGNVRSRSPGSARAGAEVAVRRMSTWQVLGVNVQDSK